ncbi:MAG: ABC transporter substrate-binding protein [Anaeromyxobacter sp.]|nr:ABC transporter substrate-binding protein [Anaeromyxobacter sp.]MBL0275884.1 ABC transporter substrate-binding protein [Anaeromyxobacter sp.]
MRGAPATATATPTPTPTPTSTPAALSSSGRGASQGGAIWIGAPPRRPARRIITLAPSLTDVLVALGATGRVVGVTRVDRAPEVAGLPRVGGFLDPNPEIILGLQPDLVLWVTDGGALAAVRRLAELADGAFPILAIPIITVADVSAAARLTGEAIGDPAGGAALADRLDAAVERLRGRAAGLPRKRVLFVVGRDPLVVAGPGSFPDELLRLAGCDNAVGGVRPWPVYPVELAVGVNPDLVIDAALDEPPEGLARLAAVPAVRAGRVVRLSSDALLRAGPKMIAALDELFLALHPEAGR